MKRLCRDNMPCWYELSWEAKPATIKLRVHKDFIKNTKPVRDNAPIVFSLKEEFGFKNFVGNFDGNFGFDNAFRRSGETKEFVEFLVKIPKIKHEGGVCKYCKGSGRNDSDDGKCLFCGGKGKEHIYEWKLARTISANFSIFSVLSYFFEKETSSSLLQLMTVRTITQNDMGGSSLDGQFSVPLCNWMDFLRESGRATIFEMIEAMQLAHKVMFGLSEGENRFRASVDYKGGWLNTSCPGDACGLNPVHSGPGYEFASHNADTPAQQIELIASLAALHDKARKEANL